MVSIAVIQLWAKANKPRARRKIECMITDSSHVYGAVKPARSIQDKRMRTEGAITDTLRFTVVCPDFQYWSVCHKLQALGTCKNYWKMLSCYKGFHVSVDDPLCPFEIQVHTKISEKLRNNTFHHDLYKLSYHTDSMLLKLILIIIRYVISIPTQFHGILMLLLHAQAYPPSC